MALRHARALSDPAGATVARRPHPDATITPMPRPLSFRILSRSRMTAARVGVVSTPHGDFDTPAFMPVGTRGTVKGVLPQQVAATGAGVLLNNTTSAPAGTGGDRRLGGVRTFMGWPRPYSPTRGLPGLQHGRHEQRRRRWRDLPLDRGWQQRRLAERATVERPGRDIIMAFDDYPRPQGHPTTGAD